MVADLGKLIEDGIVKTAVDSTFPMEDTVAAYRVLKDEYTTGKIIATIAQ
jgi:NADPH:quinone reductase-like Zn-dependent oxidoreductase